MFDGNTFDISPDEDTFKWFILFKSCLILLQHKYCSVRRYIKCFGQPTNKECYEIETKN